MTRSLLLALLLVTTTVSADVLRVEVHGVIHPIASEYVGRAIDEAAKQKADAIVLELRTPGGLDTSMREIIEKIIESPVPVLVWVGPSGSRAASAGFFILEAGDVAAMAPGTNTGAAHPVLVSGGKMDDVLKMKVQNDAAAYMRTIAQRRGRNVAVAESGVREAKSFTEDEALQQKLIDVIAPSVPALLQWANGRTIKRFDGKPYVLHVANKRIVDYELTLKQKVIGWIMDPNVAFLLLALGGLALYAEFNHPGAILPGVVGAIAIVLSIIALNLLPTSLAGFALILLAFILFAAEAKFTSYGVLGTGGALCMVLGAMMLVDGPIPELRVNLVTAIAVTIPIALIAVFLMTLVLRAQKHRVATGSEGMIGEIGVARTALAPEGKVFVHGELWNARAKSEVAEGARVRVREVDGLRVIVEAAD
ncbi:MAG TPA: nodulation protein NfeD [Thermoanaerobaculia bacterium]|nr:nodulation protein NfeD [Thermoanaerobaculia bacterium]